MQNLIRLVGFLTAIGACGGAQAEDFKWQARGALTNVVPTSSPGRIINHSAEVDN